ncbi:maltotransferase domain-containing protein [Embleya sp. NBC_00896]|uniref:alpha-1,4-glucan--maltose-1-phosphate maltosyltransferase n=1 Tax=Embleya sp. NBC_00896 TaxID=2975961 RepID=UPI00386312C4|nr:alpha-1,4-glucan--maltose-1-phosphate maltosyltransferase [Embleya sp. NBC_00896]
MTSSAEKEPGGVRAPRAGQAAAGKAAARKTTSARSRAATPEIGSVASAGGGPSAAAAGAEVAKSTAGKSPVRAGRSAKPAAPRIGRFPILDVEPVVDGGARAVRAVPGETFHVGATVFREGHDAVGANIVLRDPRGRAGALTPMVPGAPGTDRVHAAITPTSEGMWSYAVEAWGDPIATWRHAAGIKIPAELEVGLVLEEGAQLLERAAAGVPKKEGQRAIVLAAADAVRDERISPALRFAAALTPELDAVLARYPLRELVTTSARYPLRVERERALCGAWYEFFPRSEGAVVDPTGKRPPRSGTFRTAMKRLPRIAAMGFDVVYLPPIHPIGHAFRKGPNNTLRAGKHDPGSPWAIGSPEGGHDAIHPDLGTIEDFDAFVARARELRMEVALDFALQVSPEHPWVEKHPEWFRHRADGTIAYAENPPKKYQDIYPIDFDTDFDGLVAETLRVLRHWMAHGVRIFRVDNPHTKPVMFWERVLAEINTSDPDVIFLAEAFTRPAMMRTLAKVGFQQSYTYFTWRNGKHELQEYLTELTTGEASSYMRPNFFVNTPDILHAYLQYGGPAAFKIRAVLAAALSPSWGVYSGFELYEHLAVKAGSEEYLDSEKFQFRPRDWAGAERKGRSLAPYITTLNRLRRRHPSLQRLRNLTFHHVDDDAVMAFSKRTRVGDTDDLVLVVVNLDPHNTREATVALDLPALGLDWQDTFPVLDEFTGAGYRWGRHNYVRLDPAHEPAHFFSVRRNSP